jgi:hypothetical protein
MNLGSSGHMVRRLQLLMTRRAPAWLQNESRQNWTAPTLDRAGQLASASLLAVVSVAIIFARRPDQFLHPYIWVGGSFQDCNWELVGPAANTVSWRLSTNWAPAI